MTDCFKYCTVLTLLILAFNLNGCVRDEFLLDLTTPERGTMAFQVSVLKKDGLDISIQITHDGPNRCIYAIICTKDLISSPAEIYDNIWESNEQMCFRDQSKSIVHFKADGPDIYRVIVCHILDDAKPDYSSFKELQFSTVDSFSFAASPHPEWSVNWEEGSDSTVRVEVSGSAMVNDRFIVSALTENEIRAYGSMEELLASEVYDFMKLHSHNIVAARESIYHYSGIFQVQSLVGNVRAFLIGITDDGLPSGYYAESDLISKPICDCVSEYVGIYTLDNDSSRTFKVTSDNSGRLEISGFSRDNSLKVKLRHYEYEFDFEYEDSVYISEIHGFKLATDVIQCNVPAIRYEMLSLKTLGVRVLAVRNRTIDADGTINYDFVGNKYTCFYAFGTHSDIHISRDEDYEGFAITLYDYQTRKYTVLEYFELPFVLKRLE